MKTKYKAKIITISDDEVRAFLPYGIVIEMIGDNQTQTEFDCELTAEEQAKIMMLPGLIRLTAV